MILPPELTDIIVDHLHDNVYALSACALTCRAWLPTIRFHRFHHTRLPTSHESIRQFHEVLLASPEMRGMVHTLELQGQLGWWLGEDAAVWQGASFTFLALLPAVVDLRLVAMILEDSAHNMLVANLRSVKRLSVHRCCFRSFHLFVTLIGSFPSLDALTQSFALIWRYYATVVSTYVDDELRSRVSGRLRTLRLGEPWFDEEDPRVAELVPVREMLVRQLHSTTATTDLSEPFLKMLGPDILETLELDIGSPGG
ncbi:uncharacterized protein B0H18DRAFT_411328 [Fomitopsis serialis]|uniref:uncharacterized protein n=1 Tax=Fomitopsis serialis TaxID=139415 RepID=UPI002007F5CB|nr:uncharacterized protein B0H18DRAFT_411328 [Neoantrodia serialis]KAH9935354.1 hypothetical protein B0H18DRAFT_411328 [Neoantrodia serialis]